MSLRRKLRRSNSKIFQELYNRMITPDSICESCTIKKKDCTKTCKQLYIRNHRKNIDLINKVRSITGDTNI